MYIGSLFMYIGTRLILWGLQLQALSRNMQFTPQMVLYYKKARSKLQVAVEWVFVSIGNNYYFKFIDFKNLL